MPISAPQNALAVHIGSGAVLLQFDTVSNASYYEVWVSTAIDGVYSLYNGSKHYNNNIILYNVPIGINAYIKIKAVDSSGNKSSATQVVRGQINKLTKTFTVKAIRGSVIPANSIFAVPDSTGRLIAIQADEQINVL